jgi:GNAT superfamily N-acetyltransferase
MPKINYLKFSQNIKSQYPEYKDWNDLELAEYFVAQEPRYSESVDFGDLKKKDQAAPSLGEQGGLQYASTGDPIADKAQTQSALKSYSQKKDKSEEIGFWESIGNTVVNGSNQIWNGLNELLYTSSLVRSGVQPELAMQYGKFARPFKEDYKTKTREQMSLLEESVTAFAGSIPVMAASMLSGGFAGAGARVVGTLPAFISGFDQSGKEADELGITDPLDRLTFQTLGGTIEGASELIMPDASLIRPLRQRALKDIVRVGAKGLSKADAGRYIAEFTEKVAKEVGEEYAVEIGNALRNASFAAAGYDQAAPEMKSARDYAVMTISAALGAGVFAGVGTGVDAAFAKSTAIKKAAENPEAAAQAAADLVDAGKMTQEQADAFLTKVASVNKAISKMPDDVDPDVAVNTADLLNEKVGLEETVKELEENKKRIDPSFHQGIDDRIAQVTARINELTQQITEFQAPTINLDVERIDQAAPEATQMAPAEVSPEVGMEVPQAEQAPQMAPLQDLEFDNIEFIEPVITPMETQLVGEKKSPLIKETFPAQEGVKRPRRKPGEVRTPLMEQVTEGGVFKAKVRDSRTGTEFIIEDPELSLDLAIAAQVKESGRTAFPQPAFLEAFNEVIDADPELQTLFPNMSETGQPFALEQKVVSLDGKKVTRNVVQRMQPIYGALEQRMENAEEIPMSEIESVVDQIIQAQQEIQSQEKTKTIRAANGVRQEFTPLNEEQKRIFNDFTESLVNKLLSYEFATITTTGPATQKTTAAGLIATPREGRPLQESRVQREKLDGAEVTVEGRGRGRISIKPLPGLGERSVYGITFEEVGAQAPETISPTTRETGTTPAAVGVEPQTEQDVRQETNAPQEGRGQGEDVTPVPQEEGRQEGQVTPPAVAQEGETPPATGKKTRKTEQQKADEGKAILDKLKETLRALKAKPGGGANIDLTFGIVPISKAVWNTAIDTAILAIDAGQSIAQAVKAASDYISSKIDGDWGKAKFEQYLGAKFADSGLTKEEASIPQEGDISVKDVKVVKGEDFKFDAEWEVRLGDRVIGRLWYDRSIQFWMNTETMFGPGTATNPFKGILGSTKEEAIEKLVDDYNKSEKAKETKVVAQEVEERDFSNDKVLNRFLNRLSSLGGLEIPFFGDGFVYNGKALVEFDRFDKGDRNEVALRSIMAIDDTGKGVGSEVMSDITSAADELGTKLTLYASPFGTKAMSPSKLVSFYKKFGFTIDLNEAFGGDFSSEESLLEYLDENPGEGVDMVREPKAKPEPKPQQQARPEAQVEATAKALDGVDTQPLKRQLGIEANWDMIGEGDTISGKDPVLAYIQKQLPGWNRESQRGNINPNSKITYDVVRGEYGGIDQKDVVEAKDENGVVIGVVKLDTKGGIENIAVAPEFRGKGVSDKLIQTLKENNPQLDLSKTKLRSKGFEKAFGNKIIAEAYHKAKSDGSNPELVQAVEDLLGQAAPEAKPEVVKQGSRAFFESVKAAFPKRGMFGGVVITDADGTELAEVSLQIKDDERIVWINNEIPKIELSSFLSLKAGSREGFGKRALSVMKDMADKHGVQLLVYPEPLRFLKIKGVNKKFLERFYGKNGFKSPHRLSPYMVYLPQTPEAKPEKTISEQRKEFRETAKKYFDGLKKMGIAFDPEGNSKEDIAFLKALAKYIKLELDNGMVTFKGFLEKTANLIEGFNEKAVVEAAKEAWAKEVVKAYPKLYAKYSAAKRKELEREIKDIKKTMIRKIIERTDPKIVNFKSQLKTEKRRLSKEAAAQLAAINNAYDAKTMMAMEPQDLMELLNLTEGIYKEGRSEIKALNESLDEAAQIQGEEMLAAITSKDKRLDKLSDKEAARRKLKFKSGVVVAVNNDERVMLKEEAELDALTGEGYNFFFLNTTGDKVVNRGFLDSVASFFSGKLRTINENARDLRTALELIKSKSKESQDFINGLVAKMNKASVTKARKSEEWSSILKDARTRFFGPDIKFGYTNWMNAIAKVDGKALELIDGSGEPIGPINNGKIVSLYRQLMDPTNLVKTDNVRKINLSDESIQSIIDYMNLPANKPGKDFALSLTEFFLKVAKDTKAVLENNGYNSTKLDEKRYNTEDFEGDEFIAQVMGQFADTRTEGFIPYTPIQATESPDTAQGVEIKEDDLFNSGDLQKNFSVISNNMITRRPGGVIVPTDIRQTLNAYTAGMANMNAKLPLLRETQSVFSNRNLKAMSNAFAPQFTENLKANYISFMTDRVTKVDSSKSWQAIKTWLMASTAIPMFLNVKSSVLQLLASPNFMASYDFSKYIDASKKLLGDPALFKKIFVEIIDLPTVRQRFGSRFSPDSRIISEEVGRYGKVAIKIPFTNISISAKELLSKGYVFSSIGDVVSIAIGGAPIYYDISQTNKKKYIAEGMSVLDAETKAKQDAEERLFEIIQETQQSSEAMYLSEFQKQSITRLFSSFATATQQYYRKARRAAARMKNKEGEQLQNAYEILHYTAINAAVFQFFSSMFVDWLSGPGEDELEEMSREERMDLVRYMEDVMATVAQGTGGMGVALQALILAIKEGKKSGKPEKIAESALRTMPAVRMKYDAAINTMREWKRGDYVRSLTKGAELANIPADRIRSLGLQVSDALMENLDAQERIARLMGFRTEAWMREKKQGEIWNGVEATVDRSTPTERQRAISNTKSAYRDLFQLYGKRYAEATTEAEKARVDSIASKELLNVYNHRQGGQELTEELQKLFNQSVGFNSLPKDMQKLKNMETNRKIGDVVEEVLSLEKKSEQKAMEYWSSLVNNGILSDKEIDRIREEYNTRKGLQ